MKAQHLHPHYKPYNGWTNWETWQVALWIDNEYEMHLKHVSFLKNNEISATSVELFTHTVFPNGTPDMNSVKDLRKVNWEEIAEAWNDYKKEL